jgi:chromosome segregation ATPase
MPPDDESTPPGLRDRLTRQGEDALGKFAQELLENPLVNGALARAFEAREKAAQAQEVAFGALNIPSAADLERLTRRVRSVSQRLEGIEDGVDRLDERFAQLNAPGRLEERLEAIEARLDAIAKDVAAVKKASGSAPRRTARKPATRKASAKRNPSGATKPQG